MKSRFKTNLRQISAGLLAIILLITSAINTPASAQKPGGLLFGQRHRYSVVFRGNGEAIVYAKLIVTNSGDDPMTDFTFEIPRIEPYEMVVYQMELPQVCAEYSYPRSDRECKRYRDPDYDNFYYYGYSDDDATYTKINPNKDGSRYTLKLPKAIESNKTTAIILAYAGKGYVKNSFGTMKFEFETPKVASRIQEINVAVDVDSDLILRGKRTKIDYDNSDSMVKTDRALNEGISSPELDRWQRQIGLYGVVNKEAKNLAPQETMIVRGEYATSWFKLYLKQILLSLAIIAAIVVGAILLSKRLAKKRASKTTETSVQASTKTEEAKSETRPVTVPLHRHIIIGLVSAGLVVALIGAATVIGDSEIFSFMSNSPILMLLLMLLFMLLLGLIVFGPAIYIGFKYGWRKGLLLFAIELGWLIILAIIVVAFTFISPGDTSPVYYDTPYWN